NTHLAGFKFGKDFARHGLERPGSDFFQDEGAVTNPEFVEFTGDAGRDLAGDLVGDERDSFARFDAQAHTNRVACARRKLGVEKHGAERLVHLLNRFSHRFAFMDVETASPTPTSVSSVM